MSLSVTKKTLLICLCRLICYRSPLFDAFSVLVSLHFFMVFGIMNVVLLSFWSLRKPSVSKLYILSIGIVWNNHIYHTVNYLMPPKLLQFSLFTVSSSHDYIFFSLYLQLLPRATHLLFPVTAAPSRLCSNTSAVFCVAHNTQMLLLLL